jgi:ParB-like chromosome segregation protein Spo0J
MKQTKSQIKNCIDCGIEIKYTRRGRCLNCYRKATGLSQSGKGSYKKNLIRHLVLLSIKGVRLGKENVFSKNNLKGGWNTMEQQENEQETEKKYTLAYGFRRLSACKKLGWKTILSFDKNAEKIMDISIDEIYIPTNTRDKENDESFQELMSSIKHEGLLQPIGVWQTKDIKEKDYLVMNIIENVHRDNLSPYEIGLAVKRLQDLGLNIGEIAVRLSMPKSRIDKIMGLANSMPQHLRKSSYLENRSNKKGKFSITILDAISSLRLNKDAKEKLVEVAFKEELSMADIRAIKILTSKGMAINEAIKRFRNFKVTSVEVIFHKDEFEKQGISQGRISRYISEILVGKIPLNKKLFFLDDKNEK